MCMYVYTYIYIHTHKCVCLHLTKQPLYFFFLKDKSCFRSGKSFSGKHLEFHLKHLDRKFSAWIKK